MRNLKNKIGKVEIDPKELLKTTGLVESPEGDIIFESSQEWPLDMTIPLLIEISKKTSKNIKFRHFGDWVIVTSQSTLETVKKDCDKIFYSINW